MLLAHVSYVPEEEIGRHILIWSARVSKRCFAILRSLLVVMFILFHVKFFPRQSGGCLRLLTVETSLIQESDGKMNKRHEKAHRVCSHITVTVLGVNEICTTVTTFGGMR